MNIELIKKFLLDNIDTFNRVGSKALFGHGNDEDFLVDFNFLPEAMKEWLTEHHEYGGFRYDKTFMNVKNGDFDFLIFINNEVRMSYLFAQVTLKRLNDFSPSQRLKDDKTYRVSRFRKLRNYYMEHIAEELI